MRGSINSRYWNESLRDNQSFDDSLVNILIKRKKKLEFSTETWSLISVGGAVAVIGLALLTIFHATGIIELNWSNFHSPWGKKEDNEN